MSVKNKWRRLVKICNDFSELDRNDFDNMGNVEIKLAKIDTEGRKKLKKQSQDLFVLTEELSGELDVLFCEGRRNEFPKEASFIPLARRIVKEWKRRLQNNIISRGGNNGQ